MNVRDPVRICGRTVSHDFAIDSSPALTGMFQFFQNDHPGTFTQDEAVAVAVEWPRSSLRIFVVRRQGGQQIESGDTERVDHAVCSAREHRIGITPPDNFGRFTNRLAGCSTGRQTIQIGTLGIKQTCQMPGRHIGFLFKFGLGMQALQPCTSEQFQVDLPIPLRLGDQPHHQMEILLTFSSTKINPELCRIDFGLQQSGIVDGLLGGPDGKSDIAPRELESLSVINVLAQVETTDFGGKFCGEVRSVKVGN